MNIIVVCPSLDPSVNVSGISAVCNFIIANNPKCNYLHFQQGKTDEGKSGYHRVVRILKNYKAWKRFLHDNPEALIHYNFPLDAKSIIRDYSFIKYAYSKKRKMIIHIHGGLYLFKKQKPWIIQSILNRIFSYNVPIIVLSEKERTLLEKEYGCKKVFSLPNCIDLRESMIYHRSFENKRTIHILFLGRIEPNKGLDYIFDAFKMLNKENVDFVFHLAGKEEIKDSYVPAFEKELGPRFVYEGVVSGSNKICILKKCDVFLLPSFYEGLPMSLLECMSFGMVPVVTNVGSICEYVKDNENGLVVKLKESESIVNAIKTLSNNCHLLSDMSTMAKKTIEEHFDTGKYIHTLNSIYSAL